MLFQPHPPGRNGADSAPVGVRGSAGFCPENQPDDGNQCEACDARFSGTKGAVGAPFASMAPSASTPPSQRGSERSTAVLVSCPIDKR